ncbi:uncharacterized protein LOC117180627 [Belonocnema kinseyi]|uniref:uncharacterized protein LOC117180627 n=1 Tax=Belonocnema kinseyi TaxID=2817044 RepID=UPI00143CF1F9|nr:uncharacterized protein LOC117180627 [Belonocnema kinseyi]
MGPSARQTDAITESELNNGVDSKSNILKLNPFIDHGVIKVGGRLTNANLPVSQKHPIILPKNHSKTLYGVRETFWPIDGRNTTRHIVRQCVRCCRVNPCEINYLMGNLPENRCGPVFIKERRHRSRAKAETYVCVFVCFATKAVHLELASDLSSEAFLACLKRFFSRRAPHFGGLWEAAVKSFKKHFTRITGNALLTFEQLHTYVVEMKAILNSRPLTPLSSDPDDLLPLTPGDFLIGTSLMSFPQKDLRNV